MLGAAKNVVSEAAFNHLLCCLCPAPHLQLPIDGAISRSGVEFTCLHTLKFGHSPPPAKRKKMARNASRVDSAGTGPCRIGQRFQEWPGRPVPFHSEG